MTDQEDKARVLFVDDNPMMRRMLPLVLKGSGVDLLVSGNVASAKQYIKPGELARVITDGLGGAWRDIAAAAINAEIPVILYSSDSDELAAARLLDIELLHVQDKNRIDGPAIVKLFEDGIVVE